MCRRRIIGLAWPRVLLFLNYNFWFVGEDETLEKKKMDEAFEEWKSKKFALTVPLSVVALRDSIPPSWMKVRLRFQSF